MGTLAQLSARDEQDEHLLADGPQFTRWKQAYKTYSNFAVESIQQTISGEVGFGKTLTVALTRSGDLLVSCLLEICLRRDTGIVLDPYSAEQLVKSVELHIGGQCISRLTKDWLRVHDSLFRKGDDRDNYRRMIDFDDDTADGTVRRFYLPLPFYFSESPGLALPLIALQYTDVKLVIEIDAADNLNGVSRADEDLTIQAYADYGFIDAHERRAFAQGTHDYLIQQVQSFTQNVQPSSDELSTHRMRLPLNHPVVMLAWNLKYTHGIYSSLNFPPANAEAAKYAEAFGPLYSARLQLNGQDRFAERRGSYFNLVQPWQTLRTLAPAGVYMYSFALRPNPAESARQPSGALNCSQIDHILLTVTLKRAAADVEDAVTEDTMLTGGLGLTILNVHALNYNMLRVKSGMAGLMFNS